MFAASQLPIGLQPTFFLNHNASKTSSSPHRNIPSQRSSPSNSSHDGSPAQSAQYSKHKRSLPPDHDDQPRLKRSSLRDEPSNGHNGRSMTVARMRHKSRNVSSSPSP